MPQANFEGFVCDRSQCEIKEAIRTGSGQNSYALALINFGYHN